MGLVIWEVFRKRKRFHRVQDRRKFALPLRHDLLTKSASCTFANSNGVFSISKAHGGLSTTVEVPSPWAVWEVRYSRVLKDSEMPPV